MSFLDTIVKKWGAKGKKHEHRYGVPEPVKAVAGIKSFTFRDGYIEVTSTILYSEDARCVFNKASVERRVGLILLPTTTPSVDNGDGTYTHTYMTHQLRYIDPRITHQSDDRQAKPI